MINNINDYPNLSQYSGNMRALYNKELYVACKNRRIQLSWSSSGTLRINKILLHLSSDGRQCFLSLYKTMSYKLGTFFNWTKGLLARELKPKNYKVINSKRKRTNSKLKSINKTKNIKLKKGKNIIRINIKPSQEKGYNYNYTLKEHRQYKCNSTPKIIKILAKLETKGYKEV